MSRKVKLSTEKVYLQLTKRPMIGFLLQLLFSFHIQFVGRVISALDTCSAQTFFPTA